MHPNKKHLENQEPNKSRIVQRLIIPGRLPSRNEAENAARTHYSIGAEFKQAHTWVVCIEARNQRIKPVIGLAHITVTFYEKNRRRDADNVIGGGLKYILDGLVSAGVIKNDTQRYVELSINQIAFDRKNPRIEVIIEGVCK